MTPPRLPPVRPVRLVALVLAACQTPSKPATTGTTAAAATDTERLDDLEARLADLEAELADTRAALAEAESALDELPSHTPSDYTDEDALAAVQNPDPWSDPEQANLQTLWSQTDYGYQWLADSRWTMDNRANPPGERPRHELVQMFHETPECVEGSSFADCDATGALKMYVNGPRITDHDWSTEGFAAAAVRPYHTHASGLYLVSFGVSSYVVDYAYGLIAPSGIHLEPHGAHQALRIDGTGNSGENVRIDTMLGATGIALYEGGGPGLYCEALGGDCSRSYPLYIRGGTLHLEDLAIERTHHDARNTGTAPVGTSTLGIEPFYSWHIDSDSGLPVHCAWNETITDDSIVRVFAHSTSPDLLVAHSYAIVDTWGPGNAPTACTATQNIKTNAAGVYGYAFDATTQALGGVAVAILGPDTTPLDPGIWDEADRPAFSYEVVEPLGP